MQEHKLSERQACRLAGQHRSVQRYRSKKKEEIDLVGRIKKIVYEKRRFGYGRTHLFLKRNALKVNHNQVYRIYRALGFKVLNRGGRKRALGSRKVENLIIRKNQRCALDLYI